MDPDQLRARFEALPDRTKALAGLAAAAVVAVIGLVLVATGDLFPEDGGGDGGGPTTTETVSTETVSTSEPPDSPARLGHLDNPAGVDVSGGELSTDELRALLGSSDDPWTEARTPAVNGPSPQGQFRIICHPAYFGIEDPVVFPGQPGRGHLHMFFGNMTGDPSSTGESLLERGGSTCQPGPYNRSLYWMPAMLDGDGRIVQPDIITLYYKSHRPESVSGVFPTGTVLTAGLGVDGAMSSTFRASERLSWGCYNGSSTTAIRNTIPGTVSAPCPRGQDIQATLQFAQCLAVDDDGVPLSTSDNLIDHQHMLFNEAGNWGNQGADCPSSHPYRVPQISYLVRWRTVDPNGVPLDVSTWRLSSDDMMGAEPGGSLHADWMGAWLPEANELWLDGCFRPQQWNCSLGQTGGPRWFAQLVGDDVTNMEYVGPVLLETES